MPISATISQHADVTTLRLGGDLNARTRPDLYRACMLAAECGTLHLTVDLSDVTHFDPQAIWLLEDLAAQFLAGEGHAVVIAPQKSLRSMLAAHPLNTKIHVATSLEGARRHRRDMSTFESTGQHGDENDPSRPD